MKAALHGQRPDLASTLKNQAGQPGGAKAARRFRTTLATVQIAMSMALLIPAGRQRRHRERQYRGANPSHARKSIIESAMEKIIVTAKFHTGHRQPGYPGKCKFVHGHTWQGKVVVSAGEFPRDDLDMSIEFGEIKNVMRFMDHKMLVTEQDATFLDAGRFEPEGVVMLPGKGPSVENVAHYVFDGVVAVIQKQYPGKGVRYTVEVTIQETENNTFIVQKDVTI